MKRKDSSALPQVIRVENKAGFKTKMPGLIGLYVDTWLVFFAISML